MLAQMFWVETMPQCYCFHGFELAPMAVNVYELRLTREGSVDLTRIIRSAQIARTISVRSDWNEDVYLLRGVHIEAARDFFNLLDSTIIIDLDPLEECYAIYPYTVFDDANVPTRSLVGNLINQAKYRRNAKIIPGLGKVLLEFISRHPRLCMVPAISVPPKSDPGTLDLPGMWIEQIASERRLRVIRMSKTRSTEPQKALADGIDEAQASARIAGSFQVIDSVVGLDVVVLDDTIRSGGTLKEAARALLNAGAAKVYGLGLAKDARFTQGGIDLSQERWT